MSRAVVLSISALVAVIVITMLSLLLPTGGKLAVLLLDLRADTPLPYPLTIQNLMTVLFALGIGDAIHRRGQANVESDALTLKLLPEDESSVLVAGDLGPIRAKARAAAGARPTYLAALVEQCILQFQSGQSVDDTHQVLGSMTDLEMHRVDLRFTLVRYLAWVIPTLGFIGTVLGIAGALAALGGNASAEAMGGSMDKVIGPLAMAFNTTILALLLSAVLVLVIQFAQKEEEEAINRSSEYCLRNLINRLHVPR